MHTDKQLKKLSTLQRSKWYTVQKIDINSGAKHSNAKKMTSANRKRTQDAEEA